MSTRWGNPCRKSLGLAPNWCSGYSRRRTICHGTARSSSCAHSCQLNLGKIQQFTKLFPILPFTGSPMAHGSWPRPLTGLPKFSGVVSSQLAPVTVAPFRANCMPIQNTWFLPSGFGAARINAEKCPGIQEFWHFLTNQHLILLLTLHGRKDGTSSGLASGLCLGHREAGRCRHNNLTIDMQNFTLF